MLGRFIPKPLYKKLYPAWARLRLASEFWRKKQWGLSYSRSILSWVAQKPLEKSTLPMVVRSYRELRRFRNLGVDQDLVYRWMRDANDCAVFYDIGASNGIFGFAAHAMHGCKTVFIEPYTPSIESILKSIYVTTAYGAKKNNFEVIHAAIDSEENYSKLSMHHAPIPGATLNTFGDAEYYEDIYDRKNEPTPIAQWLKGISLDKLVFTYKLPAPTHVKMDIDGYEGRAIEGAKELITRKTVHSWCIEINSEKNLNFIKPLLEKHGYIEIEQQVHHPNTAAFPFDAVFLREDLANATHAR